MRRVRIIPRAARLFWARVWAPWLGGIAGGLEGLGWRVWVSLPVRPRPARRWVSRAGGPLWGVHVGQGSREDEKFG